MRIIFLLLLSAPVWASFPQVFKVEIRHPQTALMYEWDGKKLHVRDRGMKASFELRKCNEKMLDDFFAVEKVKFKDRPASEPNTIRVKRNSENFSVSGNSNLGKYLLTLKDQIMILKAQESLECK